jgi:acetyl esterase/lipase
MHPGSVPFASVLTAVLLFTFSAPAANPKAYVYKTADEVKIKADVYAQTGDAKYPMVAWFHGGALMFGNRTGVPKQLVDLCRTNGFVLASFDYRLVPQTKIPAIIEDVTDGIDWLRKRGPKLFNANPQRLVVAGASAGGYLTLMAGCTVEPPPTALVSYWGFGDISGDWTAKPNEQYRKWELIPKEQAWAGVTKEILTGTDQSNGKPQANLFNYLKQNGLWPDVATGFDPATEPAKFKPYCPIQNLTSKFPPTLFLHGTADPDVPCAQSVEMKAALDALKIPTKLITVKKGGHGLWGGDKKLVIQAFADSMEYIRKSLTTAP